MENVLENVKKQNVHFTAHTAQKTNKNKNDVGNVLEIKPAIPVHLPR